MEAGVSGKSWKRINTREDEESSNSLGDPEAISSGAKDVAGVLLEVASGTGADAFVNRVDVHKSPDSTWTAEDPAPTVDRVCALNREDLVA